MKYPAIYMLNIYSSVWIYSLETLDGVGCCPITKSTVARTASLDGPSALEACRQSNTSLSLILQQLR
jgi:hypothetical protein